MNNRKIVILLGAMLIILSGFAFRPIPEKRTYRYLTIHTLNKDLDRVFISIGGKEYKKLSFKRQVEGEYDFNPLLNLITEYENQGWELQSFTASNTMDKFVVMKQEN